MNFRLMKTLNNLESGEFEAVAVGEVVIESSPVGEPWTFTLPPDNGNPGEVMTTDGNGSTSWTATAAGSVTSVGLSAPSGQFTVSGSPVTGAGTLGLALNNSTGSSGIVLKTAPTITDLTMTGVNNILATSSKLTLTSTSVINLVDGNHGLEFNASANGPRLFGSIGGRLDYTAVGGTSLIWSEAGITLPDQRDLILTEGAQTTTITCGSTGDWTLQLPADAGSLGQALITDGFGATSWSTVLGTVTSVGLIAPSQFTVTNSPITTSGDLAFSINDSTGSNGFVLETSPTIATPTLTGTVNFDRNLYVFNGPAPNPNPNSPSECTRMFRHSTGDVMYWGHSLGSFMCAKFAWTGTTSIVTNYFELGMFGGIAGTKFHGNADVELDVYSGTGGKLILPFDTGGGVFNTSITTAATSNWTLTLPVDDGTPAQVLSTNGSGVCSWVDQTGSGAGSGTVTSVSCTTDTYLENDGDTTVSSVGTFNIKLQNTPSGTGTTLVLDTDPTFSGVVTASRTTVGDCARFFNSAEGDILKIGREDLSQLTAILSWTGSATSPSNYLSLGFQGVTEVTKFFADATVTFEGDITVPTINAVSVIATGGLLILRTTTGVNGSLFNSAGGEILKMGHSNNDRLTSIFSWNGNTAIDTNYLSIGMKDIAADTKFFADGKVTFGNDVTMGVLSLTSLTSTSTVTTTDSLTVSRTSVGVMGTFFNTENGVSLRIGNSDADRLTSIITWSGTISDNANFLAIGFKDVPNSTKFFADGTVTFEDPVLIQSDTRTVTPLVVKNTDTAPGNEIEGLHVESFNMGLDSYQKSRFGQSLGGAGDRGELTFYYNGVDNAANNFQIGVGGVGRPALSLNNVTSGTGATLNTKLSINGGAGFDYSQGSFTPTWAGTGTEGFGNDYYFVEQAGSYSKIGSTVNISLQIDFNWNGTLDVQDVAFNLPFTNTLTFWQRFPMAYFTNSGSLNQPGYFLEMHNGQSLLKLRSDNNVQLAVGGGGPSGPGGSFVIYATFTYLSE